jgi:hypothetical protein
MANVHGKLYEKALKIDICTVRYSIVDKFGLPTVLKNMYCLVSILYAVYNPLSVSIKN